MCRFSHIYNVLVVLTFVCVISYIYNVPIFLLFMDSFCSSRWPSLSFFRSCPAPVFPIYDPPPFILTIFVSFMCAFSHICNDCVVFGSICFVSCLHVLCMYWHSLSSFFCSCPAPVFPIYAPPPPTPSVPFYLYCICEGGGGRGQGGPWPMGDSGSCSGVLKYAVTWYCISTFTSLHRGLEGWGGGREWGNSYRMVRWGQRWILRRELIFYCLETTYVVEWRHGLKTTDPPTQELKNSRTPHKNV